MGGSESLNYSRKSTGANTSKVFSNSSHQGRNLQAEDKPFVSKLADNEKSCRVVKSKEQGDRMQEDMKPMLDWTVRMGVELNKEKVHLLHVGRYSLRKQYTLG